MSAIDSISKSHIAIGTPCYGDYTHEYVASMLATVADFAKSGLQLSWILNPHCPLLGVSRDLIAAIFLSRPQLTHLLWIDADIGFSPLNVGRLLGADKDCIGARCPLRTLQRIHGASNVHHLREGTKVSDEGFCEVEAIGTGFLLIRRAVFERLLAKYPELKRKPDPTFPDSRKIAPHYYGFHEMIVDGGGRQLGEDISFCRRVREMGGKIYCDMQAELTHTGVHVFQ